MKTKQTNPNAPKIFDPYIMAVNNGYEVVVNRQECAQYSNQDRYVFSSKRALCKWLLARVAGMYVPHPYKTPSSK